MMVVMGDVRDEEGGAYVASGATTVILGPFALGRRPTKTFSLCNFGSQTLSGAIVQVNPARTGYEPGMGSSSAPNTTQPGPPAELWHTYDAAAFVTLASGQTRSLVANDLFRWWRILGVNDQPTPIAVSGWCYASTL